MPIELSDITFTEQADFIAESGEEEILNTGIINTLAGNDLIFGESENRYSITSNRSRTSGIYNGGTLNTDDVDDLIIGSGKNTDLILGSAQNAISGIYNIGALNTGDGN